MELPPSVLDLSRRQRGLVTRSQLHAQGVTPAAVRWALARGRWEAVLPSVVSLRPGVLDPQQRLVAARLHAGPDGTIASLTAACWHGVTAAQDRRIHVTVPFGTHRRSAGFVSVTRTRRADPRAWERGALRVSSRARAVADAARAASTSDQATAIVCEAVERRLVTPAAVRHEIELSSPVGNSRARQALAAAEAGAWSVPEAHLLTLTSGSPHLPELWLNPSVRGHDGRQLPTPDGWFDDVGLAIQVHSWRWHSGRDQWDATVMTDGVFAEYGVPVVAVTPDAVDHSARQVLTRIERAYRSASARRRPAVTATRHDA